MKGGISLRPWHFITSVNLQLDMPSATAAAAADDDDDKAATSSADTERVRVI